MLKFTFAYILYPASVIGIFFIIILFIVGLVEDLKENDFIRAVAGIILPIISLIFIVVSGEETNKKIIDDINDLPITYLAVTGFLLGIFSIEFIRFFGEESAALPLYVMYLTWIDVFILYTFMQDSISSITVFIYALIISVLIDIIFFGLPSRNS